MDEFQAIMGKTDIGTAERQSSGLSHKSKPITKGNLKHST